MTKLIQAFNKTILKPSLVSFVSLVSFLIMGCNPHNADQQHKPENPSEPITLATPKKKAAQHNQKKTQQKKTITILALGDSLTEGLGVAENQAYPAQLEAALKQTGIHAKVVNSGLSGETSTGLLNRINWALKTKPDITILTIGANDAMRGIAIDTIEKNIRQSITKIQQGGSRVILSGMQIYDNMGEDYVKAFASMYQRIAKDTGVVFIPFFLDGVAADSKLNQSDRIHPTGEGYTRIVEKNILPVLTPVITNIMADNNSP